MDIEEKRQIKKIMDQVAEIATILDPNLEVEVKEPEDLNDGYRESLDDMFNMVKIQAKYVTFDLESTLEERDSLMAILMEE